MYSIDHCPFCVGAKELLGQKGVAYTDHNISDWPDEKLNARMLELTGRKTVPQIWIDGEHIGGYEELKALDDSGELDRKLGLAPKGS